MTKARSNEDYLSDIQNSLWNLTFVGALREIREGWFTSGRLLLDDLSVSSSTMSAELLSMERDGHPHYSMLREALASGVTRALGQNKSPRDLLDILCEMDIPVFQNQMQITQLQALELALRLQEDGCFIQRFHSVNDQGEVTRNKKDLPDSEVEATARASTAQSIAYRVATCGMWDGDDSFIFADLCIVIKLNESSKVRARKDPDAEFEGDMEYIYSDVDLYVDVAGRPELRPQGEPLHGMTLRYGPTPVGYGLTLLPE